jgi:dCTP deaminase
MILKAEKIAELLELGEKLDTLDPLVITPTPNLSELRKSGAASVDLRLGTWFVKLRQPRMTHLKVDDQEGSSQLTKIRYVPFGDEYVLHPRSFVLGVTLEWLRLPKDLAAYAIGRSSWGRRGLIIATATGVHPGFKGCLTLELSNIGEIPIAIKPGMTICQLCLHQVQSAGSEFIDQNAFVGLRLPTLGRIGLDSIAGKPAKAYK